MGYVTFTNHFHNFQKLSWKSRFAKHLAYVEKTENDDDYYDYRCVRKKLLEGYWLLQEQHSGPDLRLAVDLRGASGQAQGYFNLADLEGVMHFGRHLNKLPHHHHNSSDTSDEEFKDEDFEDEGEYTPWAEIDALKDQVASLIDRLGNAESKIDVLTRAIRESKDLEEVQSTLRHLPSPSKKRQREASNGTESTPYHHKMAKGNEQKADEHPLRLYFLWRGRNVHNGRVLAGRDQDQHGQIDFETRGGFRFHGVLRGSCLEQDIEFTGYKISHDSPPPGIGMNREWEDFSV